MASRRRVLLIRTLIVAAIVILSGPLFFMFLVAQFVGFSDPIKEYSYSVSLEQLQKETMSEINKSSSLKYELPDTVGFPKDRFLNYLTIKITDSDKYYKYEIKFEKEDAFWKRGRSSKLCVLSAFDENKWAGGYNIHDKDVQRLIDTFEIRLTNRLFPE